MEWAVIVGLSALVGAVCFVVYETTKAEHK